MVYCCGVRSGINSSLYYVSGYSTNSNYHVVNTIVSGSNTPVAKSSGNITVQNTHASDALRVAIDVVHLQNGDLTFTVS